MNSGYEIFAESKAQSLARKARNQSLETPIGRIELLASVVARVEKLVPRVRPYQRNWPSGVTGPRQILFTMVASFCEKTWLEPSESQM